MKTKKLFQILVMLVMIAVMLPAQTAAHAVATYNRDAAVSWAEANNYNDGLAHAGRPCTLYVSKALQAGGISIPDITNNVILAEWLNSNPSLWEIKPISQLEKGDFVFLDRTLNIDVSAANHNNPAYHIDHVILVTGPDLASAWNVERLNTKLSGWTWPYMLGIHIKTDGGTATPPPTPSLIFKNGISKPTIDTNSINLTVTADNLSGNIIYVQMWRNAVGTNGERVWNTQAVANGNSITFSDLDGAGPVFTDVTYYLVASLQPIGANDAKQQRTSCYSATGGVQLCDAILLPGNTSSSFVNGVSKPTIDTNTVNLTINADNLNGKTVYVQMWRNAVGTNGERVWDTQAVASGNSITFSDLDGAGPVFTDVSYYTVASLQPIGADEAKKQRTSCYSATGGAQLCDLVSLLPITVTVTPQSSTVAANYQAPCKNGIMAGLTTWHDSGSLTRYAYDWICENSRAVYAPHRGTIVWTTYISSDITHGWVQIYDAENNACIEILHLEPNFLVTSGPVTEDTQIGNYTSSENHTHVAVTPGECVAGKYSHSNELPIVFDEIGFVPSQRITENGTNPISAGPRIWVVSGSTSGQITPTIITREQIYWDKTYTGNVDALRYEKWPVYFSDTRTFTITATTTSGDLVPLIILQDQNGNEVARGVGSLTSTQPAGNYFVLIQPQTGSGAYSLTIVQSTGNDNKPLAASVMVNPSSIYVDGTADVVVNLTNVPAEGLMSAEFTCTATGLEVSNITDAGLFGPDAPFIPGEPQNGVFISAIAGSNGNKATTDGPALRFTVKGLQVGQFPIECKVRVSKNGKTLVDVPTAAISLTVKDVTPPPSTDGTFTGSVVAGKPVTVTLTNAAGVAVNIPVNADGSFSQSVLAGTYTATASAPGFLSAQGTVTITAGQTTTLPQIALLAGDVTGDGKIDGLDVITIGSRYNQSDPTAADLNNDGLIDWLDLTQLAQNYRKSGPVEWK